VLALSVPALVKNNIDAPPNALVKDWKDIVVFFRTAKIHG
jgi:hypothetical protein